MRDAPLAGFRVAWRAETALPCSGLSVTRPNTLEIGSYLLKAFSTNTLFESTEEIQRKVRQAVRESLF